MKFLGGLPAMFATLAVMSVVLPSQPASAGPMPATAAPADLSKLIVVRPDRDRILYFSEPGRRTLIYFHTVTSQPAGCPHRLTAVSGVWVADFGTDINAAAAEYRTQRDSLNDSALVRRVRPLRGIDQGEVAMIEDNPPRGPPPCRRARHEELFRVRGVVVFVTQDHIGAFDERRGIAAKVRARLTAPGRPT